MDKICYHYTSIETLYNMLDKSIEMDKETREKYLKLRATNIEYLNDTTERKLFTDALYNKLLQYGQDKNSPITTAQREQFNLLCTSEIYVISFSELQDDLNMWRGYAGNGVGANIGFNFSNIQPFYPTENGYFKMERAYKLVKCKYYLPEECDIEFSLVENIYNFLKYGGKTFDNVRLMQDIMNFAVIHKHKAYSPEKEWRLYSTPTTMPQFTFSNGIVRPYIDFKIPVDAITSITFGPRYKDDYKIKSIRNFIKMKIRPDIKIIDSEIPYRG